MLLKIKFFPLAMSANPFPAETAEKSDANPFPAETNKQSDVSLPEPMKAVIKLRFDKEPP